NRDRRPRIYPPACEHVFRGSSSLLPLRRLFQRRHSCFDVLQFYGLASPVHHDTARSVDRGSVVNGSTIGFTIVDTHLVKAAFTIPDFKVLGIRKGQKQAVLLEPLQRTAMGVVTSISPQADPQSRVFTVEVTLDNPHEDIRPGMIGSLILGQTR